MIVDSVFESMKEALETGHHIELRGFGTFKVVPRKARRARNPVSGKPVDIPPRNAAVFKPAKDLKSRV